MMPVVSVIASIDTISIIAALQSDSKPIDAKFADAPSLASTLDITLTDVHITIYVILGEVSQLRG